MRVSKNTLLLSSFCVQFPACSSLYLSQNVNDLISDRCSFVVVLSLVSVFTHT